MTKHKGESLLAWAASLPAAPRDPNETQLRAGFAEALAHFLNERTRDAAALNRYLARLYAIWGASKELREKTWCRALLGVYFIEGMKQKRPAGRRQRSGWGLAFIHIWHEINLTRSRLGLPVLVDVVPAKEIAVKVAELRWGYFTPRQVSDILRKTPGLPRPAASHYG